MPWWEVAYRVPFAAKSTSSRRWRAISGMPADAIFQVEPPSVDRYTPYQYVAAARRLGFDGSTASCAMPARSGSPFETRFHVEPPSLVTNTPPSAFHEPAYTTSEFVGSTARARTSLLGAWRFFQVSPASSVRNTPPVPDACLRVRDRRRVLSRISTLYRTFKVCLTS